MVLLSPIFRALYWIYRGYSGLRHWTVRRFTPLGLALAGGVGSAALLGFDTDNTVGYQAFALMFCLLVVALVFSPFFRAKFSVSRILPRFATVGMPMHYDVEVRNLGARTQAGLTLLDDLADPRPDFRSWLAVQLDDEKHLRPFRFNRERRLHRFRIAKIKEAELPLLPAGQTARARVELTPLRRGVLRFESCSFARPDPLGLFRSIARHKAEQAVLVLPKRYWLPPVALPGLLKYQQGGVAMASHVGQSEEFVSLRDYRRGDPPRHIHWRTWARVGKPIVKEFEDEFFVRHALILDTFTERPRSEAFEEAVSVAASFACTVLTQESLLDLLFIGSSAYCFTAGRGLAHADQMLEILASVQPCAGKPFGDLENLVVNHVAAVSGCICVLLAWDKERQQLVKKLKSLGLPVVVLVVTTTDDAAPLEPGPMRDDPTRLHKLEVGRIEEQLARLA
ncbi:MAG: DUF58 domain-containing protein [Verrucomicrobia bacterium]|nr:MAG: DUF58 domain-containing protein [Verrucomicrobiota bacterium]